MILELGAAGIAAALAGGAWYGRGYSERASRTWPAEGRMIDADDARLHVLETGDAANPRVLLIHGASANLRELWGPLAADLARDHRVIAYDRPGFGHSTRPRRGAQKIATQAHFAAKVLEQTGSGPAILVAHSMGSAVALRTALDRPDLVSGLVLVAPFTHPYPHQPSWWARLAAVPLIGEVFCFSIIPCVGPIVGRSSVANNFWPSETPKGFYEEAGVGLVFRPATFRANAIDVCATKTEFAALAPLYADLLTPTIVIAAEKDKIVSPKRHARALAAELQSVELVTAPGAGHMPHRLRPDLVLSAVRRVGSMVTPPAER
ncbi:probable hydrolase [alpha proteobacterium U9-1i]|nr:probable hydrolase [alpha proteobacterium U9-1i]